MKIEHHKISADFLSPGYIIAEIFTFAIFFLGFKWTLFGIYWVPFILNPFVYACVVLFWLYYNFAWIRTALYLPTTILYVSREYTLLDVKLTWWNCFYIALCKINKVRKEDRQMRRECDFIDVLAGAFRKPAILANFKRGEAKDASTAVFIHTKRKVISFYKAITPFMAPTFIVILILTPLIVFLSSYNYRFFMEHFVSTPMMMTFGMYMIILPFKLIWVFMVLSVLAANVLSPLVTLPCINVFTDYVKEQKTPLNLYKKHTLSLEGFMCLFMLGASLAFYISIFVNILL